MILTSKVVTHPLAGRVRQTLLLSDDHSQVEKGKTLLGARKKKAPKTLVLSGAGTFIPPAEYAKQQAVLLRAKEEREAKEREILRDALDRKLEQQLRAEAQRLQVKKEQWSARHLLQYADNGSSITTRDVLGLIASYCEHITLFALASVCRAWQTAFLRDNVALWRKR